MRNAYSFYALRITHYALRITHYVYAPPILLIAQTTAPAESATTMPSVIRLRALSAPCGANWTVFHVDTAFIPLASPLAPFQTANAADEFRLVINGAVPGPPFANARRNTTCHCLPS